MSKLIKQDALAEDLRHFIKKTGFTLTNIRSHTHISESTLSRIATSAGGCDMDSLIRLCLFMQVDVSRYVPGGDSLKSSFPTAIEAIEDVVGKDERLNDTQKSGLIELMRVAYKLHTGGVNAI